MNKVVTGLFLVGGLGIAAYVVYRMYQNSKAQDAFVTPPQAITIPVQPFTSAKPKPKPVVRVV